MCARVRRATPRFSDSSSESSSDPMNASGSPLLFTPFGSSDLSSPPPPPLSFADRGPKPCTRPGSNSSARRAPEARVAGDSGTSEAGLLLFDFASPSASSRSRAARFSDGEYGNSSRGMDFRDSDGDARASFSKGGRVTAETLALGEYSGPGTSNPALAFKTLDSSGTNETSSSSSSESSSSVSDSSVSKSRSISASPSGKASSSAAASPGTVAAAASSAMRSSSIRSSSIRSPKLRRKDALTARATSSSSEASSAPEASSSSSFPEPSSSSSSSSSDDASSPDFTGSKSASSSESPSVSSDRAESSETVGFGSSAATSAAGSASAMSRVRCADLARHLDRQESQSRVSHLVRDDSE